MKPTPLPPPFILALRVAIKTKVRQLRANGVTGMSVANLRNVVPAPSHTMTGAPAGTNAVWLYGQVFAEEALKVCPEFLLP